jgi:hypothetical protein
MAKFISRDNHQNKDAGFFAQGGKTKMFGKGHTGKVESGQSGKSSQGSENGEFAKGGGSNEMFGKGHAGNKVPAVSGKQSQVG